VPVEQIETLNVEELARLADYDSFEREYPRNFDRFAHFLTANGLPHKLIEAHPKDARSAGSDHAASGETHDC